MRIGLVYLGRRGSGGPISYELANNLSSQTSVFAVISRQAENIRQWQGSNLERIEVNTYQNIAQAVASWLNQPALKNLSNKIQSRDPDVLLFPMFHTWVPSLQRYLKNIPTVLTVHDPSPHPGLFDWFDYQFQNLAIRRATRCIILSQNLAGRLENRGIDRANIDVIPHGVLSYYRRISQTPVTDGLEQKTPEDSQPIVLFFGRLEEYKGVDVLLEAFSYLQDLPVQLSIVGAGDFNRYKFLAARLKKVSVTNRWVAEDEVALHFRSAAMLVLPYISATQSGVLAIAADFSLPVVATRVGGIPEQVIDQETGLLVAPNDPRALAGAIRSLLTNPSLAHRLGKNLHYRQAQDNNWNKIASMTLESCQKAVSQFKRSRQDR